MGRRTWSSFWSCTKNWCENNFHLKMPERGMHEACICVQLYQSPPDAREPGTEPAVPGAGGSYVFVQTEPMEQERVDMGWGEEKLKEGDFVRSYWEDENGCQRMIEEADAVIFGGCEDERYIEARLEAGKPVWRYSEPLYKTGRYKFVSPRGLRKKYHDHTRYRKKRVYLLCAGAYVAGDFRLVGAYGGKRFRYGYFPAFRQQDPKKLMAGKDQASQGQLRLLWAARMIDWKHPETALQVAAGLREQGIGFRLDMIGAGAGPGDAGTGEGAGTGGAGCLFGIPQS